MATPSSILVWRIPWTEESDGLQFIGSQIIRYDSVTEHVCKGHLKALDILSKDDTGVFVYNLGSGTGYSVLDIIKAFEKANGIKIKYKIVERRPGDIAKCYADPSKAWKELGWKAEKTLEDMVRDAWNFEQRQH